MLICYRTSKVSSLLINIHWIQSIHQLRYTLNTTHTVTSTRMASTSYQVDEIDTNSDLSSWERRFEKKIYCKSDPSFMMAYTLLNGISVMYCSAAVFGEGNVMAGKSIKFSDNINSTTSNLSGKRKKGAIKIKRGATLCQLNMSDGSVINLRSPIAGEIVEINTLLNDNMSLLRSENGDGYVMVLLRNKTMELTGTTKANKQCFNFLKGQCIFGDKCKFKHISPPITDGADDDRTKAEVPQEDKDAAESTCDGDVLSAKRPKMA